MTHKAILDLNALGCWAREKIAIQQVLANADLIGMDLKPEESSKAKFKSRLEKYGVSIASYQALEVILRQTIMVSDQSGYRYVHDKAVAELKNGNLTNAQRLNQLEKHIKDWEANNSEMEYGFTHVYISELDTHQDLLTEFKEATLALKAVLKKHEGIIDPKRCDSIINEMHRDVKKLFAVGDRQPGRYFNEDELTLHPKNFDYLTRYVCFAYAIYNPLFEQLTTQYSLHILEKPGAELKHKAFIHDEYSNPSRNVAEQLLADIKDDNGSIVVYHLTFERDRTEELAQELPDLADQLRGLIARMWDLETPFAKRWFWDHRFAGSSSIKNVLPIFKPDFSYKDLVIQKGDQAQIEYSKMIGLPQNDSLRLTIKEALLAYCERDSLAMYFILKDLFDLFPKDRKKAAV